MFYFLNFLMYAYSAVLIVVLENLGVGIISFILSFVFSIIYRYEGRDEIGRSIMSLFVLIVLIIFNTIIIKTDSTIILDRIVYYSDLSEKDRKDVMDILKQQIKQQMDQIDNVRSKEKYLGRFKDKEIIAYVYKQIVLKEE